MAIIKDFVTPQGITANYHRLVKTELDANQGTILYTVAVYLSKEAREAGCSPLWHNYVNVPFTALTSDYRQQHYEQITNYYESCLKGSESDVTVEEYTPSLTTEAAKEAPVDPSPPSNPAPENHPAQLD